MRSAPIIVLALLATGFVASAAPVQAHALRVSRQPDATIDLCALGAKCAPVAVGDFNGDGMDDVAFQQNTRSERQLHIVFGPFGASLQPPVLLTFTQLDDGQNGLLATDVADMDGDGRDELLVGDVNVTGKDGVEHDSIFVVNFAVLAADNEPPSLLADSYFIGRTRPPFVWRRDAPIPESANAGIVPRIEVRGADMNGDGVLDLVLGIDRTGAATSSSSAAAIASPTSSADSEVIVQFMQAGAFRPTKAELAGLATITIPPSVSLPLRPLMLKAGEESVHVTGLGRCTRGGLAGVADVTGDGVTDLVVRRCEGGGLPDQLGLVEGRSSWPAAVKIAGAIEPSTPPELPPAPGRPGTPPEPPGGGGGGGYIQVDPRGPAMNIFDALPTFFTKDLNGDGVLDVGFGLADKTHVWLGGPELGARLVEDRSDRIFLGAGLGGSMANRTWRPTDLDGDGRRDLALTRLRTAAIAKRDPAGNAIMENSASEPIHIFAHDRNADDVIDVAFDKADDIWSDARYTLWAFGDFNGDGIDDVMLGSPAAAMDSEYPVMYGPFVRR